MRPKSIVRYEMFYLAAVLLGIAATAMSWGANINTDEMKQIQGVFGTSFLPIFFVFVYTLSLALWYFTARSPNIAAKWIVTIWFMLSLIGLVMSLGQGQVPTDLSSVLSLAAIALNAVAVYLLFRPDARAWFGEAA